MLVFAAELAKLEIAVAQLDVFGTLQSALPFKTSESQDKKDKPVPGSAKRKGSDRDVAGGAEKKAKSDDSGSAAKPAEAKGELPADDDGEDMEMDEKHAHKDKDKVELEQPVQIRDEAKAKANKKVAKPKNPVVNGCFHSVLMLCSGHLRVKLRT